MQPLFVLVFCGLRLAASSLLCVSVCELVLTEGQEAQHRLVTAELCFQRSDCLGLCLELEELIVACRLLSYRIGELLEPPVLFVHDLSAFALEYINELCDRFLYLASDKSGVRMKTVS